ncbi:hypothetical protein [Pararobbsia silviterrae]|uniref:Enoyl-CoA hydratase n=1 Tax=Pararobbsia silviterrae TaxID=1792498 RepID=A0A494X2W8_9BURK|nr:hypothetical protein [Pararobbsia silviterrae]RKP44690.1 hypothetical protein D7S86_27050 [Pararobbsia silviterrae]
MKFAFYKGNSSLLDKLISWWMRGPYSHVEVILGEGPRGTYTIASSVPGIGVRIATHQTLPLDEWDIIDGPGNIDAARAWFEKRVGAPYDYVGLLGFVLRPATGDARGKYWCSEAALEAIGFPGAWRYDPNAMFDVITYSARAARA